MMPPLMQGACAQSVDYYKIFSIMYLKNFRLFNDIVGDH